MHYLRYYLDNVFFAWIWQLAKKARLRPLQKEHLPTPPKSFFVSSEENSAPIHRASPWHLFWTLVRHHRWVTCKTTAAMLVRIIVTFSVPLLLGWFIQNMHVDRTRAIYYGMSLVVACAAQAFIVSYYFARADRLKAGIQNSLCRRLFHFFFTMTREGRSRMGKGTLLNIVGEDTEALGEVAPVLIEFSHDILTIVLGVTLLFYYLGIATLGALIPLSLLGVLINAKSAAFEKAERAFLKEKDNRVTMLSRIFESIRQIKLAGLQNYAYRDVQQARDRESRRFRSYIRADIGTMCIYGVAIVFIPLLTFTCYALLGNPFQASIIFPALLIMSMLEDPFADASLYIGEIAKVRVVGQRILDLFSTQADAPTYEKAKHHDGIALHNVAVPPLQGGGEERKEDVLQGISLSIQKGEHVAVVGGVGAGKSCLLHALLGETSLRHGAITMPDVSLGWTPQQPVLFQDSIGNNITFGDADTPPSQIIHACVLEKDIAQLPKGIHTLVGNRGVTLSGGQVQRVALARTAYHNPDVIVLDDPFSSVDLQTEDRLVDNLLRGLWKEKTVIAATHRVRHLDCFDTIVFLEHGKIEAVGSLEELKKHSKRFAAFIREEKQTHATPNAVNLRASRNDDRNDAFWACASCLSENACSFFSLSSTV